MGHGSQDHERKAPPCQDRRSANEYCASHYIRYDTVYDLVLIDLRSVLWNYRHNKKQFKSFLEKKFQTDSAKEAMKLQTVYEKKQSRFEEIDQILCKQYEESDATDKYVNLIKKYTVIDQLDAAILNELIDKIVVHHKEIADDGRVFQQVEIYYRFIGKLDSGSNAEKTA